MFHQPTLPKAIYNEAIPNSTSAAHHKLCEGSLFLHIRADFLHHVEYMTVVNTYYHKMSYYVCHVHDPHENPLERGYLPAACSITNIGNAHEIHPF